MASILIIDDDTALCQALEAVVAVMGHSHASAHSVADGLAAARAGDFQVIILDVWLPDGNGLEALPQLRETPSAPEVIILTGSGDPDGAELAIRSGAWDYITKPPSLNKIRLPVERALDFHTKKHERDPPVLRREDIVGESNAMRACLELVARAAGTEANVLITGETGTGKELFAQAIHDNSQRADNPFVVVDCAALPENLVESMLFGHERGAFTNADRKYEGLVRQAHRGTLFLDEVGELPYAVQKSFLRVLQEHRFRPVGGIKEIVSDFRLVAATNRDLDELANQGRFRRDVLFRIQSINIHLPPLRGRVADIKALARHYAPLLCQRMGSRPKVLSEAFLEAMAGYDWPGNVRELVNALENAVAGAKGETELVPSHLPTNIRAQIARDGLTAAPGGHERPGPPPLDGERFPSIRDYRAQALENLEGHYLRRLMDTTKGDMARACAVSGLSRARLYALLKERGVDRGGAHGPGQGPVAESD